MVTIRRFSSGSLPVLWWLAGLGAIALATGLYVWLLHLTSLDDRQQLQLLQSLAAGDLVHALEGVLPPQTSGPGFAVVGLPVFVVARAFVSDQGAYEAASLACLVPLLVAVVAASRATGVERRSLRELAGVAVVVLGTPTMANVIEALHPADLLATAACLGAFAALASRRVPVAFALLGFALVTRQWAIIAVAVLAALERGDDRRHLVLGSIGVATVLLLPFFVANPGQVIVTMQAEGMSRGPMAGLALLDLPDPVAYALSRLVPLVGTAALCTWLVRRRVPWSPEVAVAALAVAFLIRPPFDPGGSLYYAAPGYAFFVLMGPRTWRWLGAGVAGSVALLVRFSLRHRFPYARVISLFGVEGPYQVVGVMLAIATTAIFLAALVAATVHLRALVAGHVDRADRPAAPLPVG